jgi:hypothetical protein
MIAPLSRRGFLAASAGAFAACTTSVGGISNANLKAAGNEGLPTTRIRKIYLAKPIPTWPKPDLDVPAEIRRIEEQLASMATKMPGVRFEGGDLYRIAQDVPTSAAAFSNPDGFLIFNLTSTVSSHIERIAGIGMPAILYSQPYSGHEWSSIADMQRKGLRIFCLSTSDFNEIPGACRLIRTAHLMRAARILYVNTSPYNTDAVSRIKERLGCEVIHMTPEQVVAAYQAVDEAAARADARAWIAGAMRVVEPSEEEVGKSSRLYLALRGLMQEQRAQAVTINCLGLFNQKKLPAYPCLAFCKMNDLGLVGVCEGDVDSTLTQLIFTYAFGIPGYVSDPVIDTSTNTVIHAHCVSAHRLHCPCESAGSW